jgi:hypothetical protein
MRRFVRAALAVTLLSASIFVGTAYGLTGRTTGDTVMYRYQPVAPEPTGGDSSTCGGSWAIDKEIRIFRVYKEQANNGAYQVTAQFTDGSFTTLAGASPESCEAGTSNTLAAGVHGSFHGTETLIVSNTDKTGNWDPTTDVPCSSPCTTAEWIANAFGPNATYTTANDWWFSYSLRGVNASACGNHWINAAYGNSGDIATTCVG